MFYLVRVITGRWIDQSMKLPVENKDRWWNFGEMTVWQNDEIAHWWNNSFNLDKIYRSLISRQNE